MVATCTGGERGSILNPKMESPENWANLAALRNAEMARAAEILGIEQVWLGYVDSGMPAEGEELPPDAFARLEKWQTDYVPVYAIWAAIVVVVFPLVFAFA